MKINIEHNIKTYQIDSDDGVSISIPVQFNQNLNPKFYDESNPSKEYYKSNGIEYNLDQLSGCNVPLITMNIHCSGTHTETAAHVIKDSYFISDLTNMNFIPATLISITSESNINENYHIPINNDDEMITKETLEKYFDSDNKFSDCIIIRTLPNDDEKKIKNYNKHAYPFLSNNAVFFLKEMGIKHIVIDTPSIDRFDDGGQLENHKIFFKNQDGSINKNTITELVFVPNHCSDGKYFICIGIPKFKLDAAPSNPVIYKVL